MFSLVTHTQLSGGERILVSGIEKAEFTADCLVTFSSTLEK